MKKVVLVVLKFFSYSFLIVLILCALGLSIGVNLPLKEYTQKPEKSAKLMLKNCNIVDVKEGRILAAQTIVIDNGEMVRIDSDSTPIQQTSGFRVIDAGGAYIMPALWDMHFHTLSLSPQLHFPLMLAHGVTGARDMGDGDSWISKIDKPLNKDKDIWEEKVRVSGLLMPRLPESCSYHVEELEGDEASKEAIYSLIRKLKQRKEPFVKLQLEDSELPEEAFYTIQKAGREENIRILGHLSYNVDFFKVMENGYGSIEHAWALIPHCSNNKKQLKKDIANKEHQLSTQDSALTLRVMAALASHGTYYCPTHVTSNKKEAFIFDATFRQNPHNDYIEGTQFWLWNLWANLHISGFDKPNDRRVLEGYYKRGLELTGIAHKSGVKILAGTDALDRYTYHGISLHGELQELVKAGMSNADALRSATLVAAEYYGITNKFGSIEVGKTADFIMLSANPLENIANTQTIQAVYFQERLYDRTDLDAMKQFVREQAHSYGVSCTFIWNMIKGLF